MDAYKPKPGIILLDLNMPKMAGLELLKIIKNNEDLKRIPVVIFTTSNGKKDIEDGYNLGATGYMVKPVEFQKYNEIIKAVYNYWVLCEDY